MSSLSSTCRACALSLSRSKLCPLRPPTVPAFSIRGVRQQHTASESRLPRIAQPSFWQGLVPRAWLKQNRPAGGKEGNKPPNPSTYFIWIYIFIGSQAIRIMQVKNEFNTYMRKADLKLEILREVIRKVQNGEPVDVEKVLGTGDEVQEQEWEDALREIQEEDAAWQKGRKQQNEDSQRHAADQQDASPVNDAVDKTMGQTEPESGGRTAMPVSPGFY